MQRRDPLTVAQRHKTMRRVRSKDTGPEMIVRRLVYGLGCRYRLHVADLPGKPDLVFRGRRKIIFVHGCFWHRHDCPAGRKMPVTNRDYWEPKLWRNQARDLTHRTALEALGWQVLIIWGCEMRDLEAVRARLSAFLRDSDE